MYSIHVCVCNSDIDEKVGGECCKTARQSPVWRAHKIKHFDLSARTASYKIIILNENGNGVLLREKRA